MNGENALFSHDQMIAYEDRESQREKSVESGGLQFDRELYTKATFFLTNCLNYGIIVTSKLRKEVNKNGKESTWKAL